MSAPEACEAFAAPTLVKKIPKHNTYLKQASKYAGMGIEKVFFISN
jgi:hypothetical protein